MPVKVRKVVPIGYKSSDLAARFEGAAAAGGGIRPGAHPEFEQETPAEKVIAIAKRARNVLGKLLAPRPPRPIGNSARDAHAQRAYEFGRAERKRNAVKR